MFLKHGWLICLVLYFFYVIYWGFGFPNYISGLLGASYYFLPEKKIVNDFIQQGLIPLWNPYLACGLPLLADYQSACFYPFTWIHAWFNFSNKFDFSWVFHEFVAFYGFYLWLRLNRVGRLWSALGSIGYAGSAQMVLSWGFNGYPASLAWVPWVFWSAQSALKMGGVQRWTLVTLIFALELLSGYPPLAFYTFLFGGGWAIWMRAEMRAYVRLVFCGLTAILLTAVQWLPFFEYLAHGQRVLGEEYPYHFRADDFLRLINPYQGPIGSLEYHGLQSNGLFNPYIGIPALVLLIWSFFKPFSDKNSFWRWSALFILVWLAGRNGPADWLLPSGILNALEPSKAAFLFVFCAITASVQQGDGWLDSKDKKKRIMVLIVIVIWLLDGLILPFRIRQQMPNPYLNSSVLMTAQAVGKDVGDGRVIQLMTSSDYSWRLHQDLPNQILEGVQMMEPNTSGVFGIRTLAANNSLAPDGFLNLVRYGNKAYPYPGRLFDLAGVKAFLGKRKMPGPKYESVPIDGKFILNINKRVLPSLREVGGARYFENRPSVLEATTLENADVEKEVFLEKDPAGLIMSLPPDRRPLEGNKRSENLTSRYSPQRAVWVGETHLGSYVVFNETFFPGWKAWLDGRPVPIYRAYGDFMAVSVNEDSSHRVDFGYEPASFRLGLFISLVTLFLFLAMRRFLDIGAKVKGWK